MRIVLLIFATLILTSHPVLTQDITGPKKVTWEFGYTKGFSFGGPSIHYQLSQTNYNLHTVNFSPDIISIDKNIWKFTGAGIIIGKVNQDIQPIGAEFRTLFLSPALRLHFNKIISIEAGPSFNFVSYYHTVAQIGPGVWMRDDRKYFPVGILMKSAFEFPAESTIFFKAEAQYLDQGRTKTIGEEIGFHQYLDLNPDRKRLYSWYAGAGFGIRFKSKKHL